MKRLIFLIFTILIVSFSSTVYGEERNDLKRGDIPTASTSGEILNKLNIIYGTDLGLELDREITRAEAVVILMRIYPEPIGALGINKPVFSDMDGHWAYKEVTYAKKIGFVDGVSKGLFEPNRTVSGKEFTKMVLSLMGYEGVTTENAYNIGSKTNILNDNFEKSVVYNDYKLLRGDVARIIQSALIAKCNDGSILKDKLINSGKFKIGDFDVLVSSVDNKTNSTFSDRLNKLMPKDKNYMYSPLSVKMALALAANGSNGKTKAELLDAVGVKDLDEFNSKSKNIIESFGNSEKLKLSIANSIWINKDATDTSFSNTYKKIVTDYYFAKAMETDNKNAVKNINSWVSDNTNNKIPSIIDSPDFASALINAIYFKGNWKNSFDKNATAPDIFTDGNGNKSQIDFMNKTAYFNYVKTENSELIELPYETYFGEFETLNSYDEENLRNMNVSMYILLADNEIDVEGEINKAIENNSLKYENIALSMPKFKIEYCETLNNMLKKLGINTAFNKESADFKNMFNNGNMYISRVLHKTYIDVDENGTEAAAVTAIIMKNTAMMPIKPLEFKVNRPFYFAIRDNVNGEILFMGRYAYTK